MMIHGILLPLLGIRFLLLEGEPNALLAAKIFYFGPLSLLLSPIFQLGER